MAAARLARSAVACTSQRVWLDVVVDGKQLVINEDDNFWCESGGYIG